jgi:molybdopterin-dependent oxidoreductase alpha subunit
MRTLLGIRRRGGHVIVINPMKEIGLVNFRVPSDVRSLLFGSKIASLYLQPHIGGDLALLTGMAKQVIESGETNTAFVEEATEGFANFAQYVRDTSWDEIERGCGVPRDQTVEAAKLYCQAKRVVIGWTMGITHHQHGVANVQAIVNLALLRGMVGKPGAGLLPIRGHSNVQGLGSMGVVPVLRERILNNLESYLGVKLPKSPGLDTMACMQAADGGAVRSAFCLGGNLFGSNPDAKFAHRALGKLELATYLNTTLNTAHAWGRGRETLVLPVLARDEEPHPTTQESMFNFVRLSDGQQPRLQGPRSEVDIITNLAHLVLGRNSPLNWQELRHGGARQMIASVVPGYEKMGQLDNSRAEFHVTGRTLHEPRFPTPSGKARFVVHPLPPLLGEGHQLRLMTLRSEGQFNTVVYEEEDIYRGQERRDVILMSREDIDRLGLQPDQRVTVRSAVGVMPGILVREYDIRSGNAVMYYPEANVLVPTTVDPRSKTPAFKCVLVTLEPEAATAAHGPLVQLN